MERICIGIIDGECNWVTSHVRMVMQQGIK
jgi:hypothetical protein